MSETAKKGSPMPGLDAVLRDWPDASGGEGARVESVMSRLTRGEHGGSAAYVSEDDLFADPLGLSEEDGHNAQTPGAMVSHPTPLTPRAREGNKMNSEGRERDRKSLQDLAKMAQGLTPPAPSSVAAPFSHLPSSKDVSSAKKDDSGIVDLAAASAADPGAAMRAQSTPLASHSLFEEAPRSVPPAQMYHQPAPSVPPPPSVAPPSYGNVRPFAPLQKKSNTGGVVLALGGLLAMAGVAAGGFVYVRAHKAPAPVVATTATPTETKASAPAATATQVADNSTTPADPVNAGTDLNALPSIDPSTPTKRRRHAASGGAVAQNDDDSAPAAAPAKGATADKFMPPPSGPPGDLGAAMKAAVPDNDTAQRPAAASNGSASMGNVPQKPSQGAVTGALGAVLPSARGCLGPDDPISRANIVFNSDGSVNNVTVTGGAQGKPAEACIKDKLKSAKLQPFAEPSYTANITIRHN